MLKRSGIFYVFNNFYKQGNTKHCRLLQFFLCHWVQKISPATWKNIRVNENRGFQQHRLTVELNTGFLFHYYPTIYKCIQHFILDRIHDSNLLKCESITSKWFWNYAISRTWKQILENNGETPRFPFSNKVISLCHIFSRNTNFTITYIIFLKSYPACVVMNSCGAWR